MASFGGNLVFGSAVRFTRSDNPREAQINSYFGLSGVERIDGGGRGGTFHVTGLHAGASVGALVTSQTALRDMQDGNAYVLVDTKGEAYPNCVLEGFKETGPVRQSPGGAFLQTYECTITELGQS